MGKSTISMAVFNSYVKSPEGNYVGESQTASRKWMACNWNFKVCQHFLQPKDATVAAPSHECEFSVLLSGIYLDVFAPWRYSWDSSNNSLTMLWTAGRISKLWACCPSLGTVPKGGRSKLRPIEQIWSTSILGFKILRRPHLWILIHCIQIPMYIQRVHIIYCIYNYRYRDRHFKKCYPLVI